VRQVEGPEDFPAGLQDDNSTYNQYARREGPAT